MSDGDYQTEQWQPSVKDIVKGNMVVFDSYRQGHFYYNVVNPDDSPQVGVYQFPVPIDDIGTATLLAEDKASIFMRWIRKAIEDKTLRKL